MKQVVIGALVGGLAGILFTSSFPKSPTSEEFQKLREEMAVQSVQLKDARIQVLESDMDKIAPHTVRAQ